MACFLDGGKHSSDFEEKGRESTTFDVTKQCPLGFWPSTPITWKKKKKRQQQQYEDVVKHFYNDKILDYLSREQGDLI